MRLCSLSQNLFCIKLETDIGRFDGRVIRVDKASDRSGSRNDGGWHGRGGYNRSEGGGGYREGLVRILYLLLSVPDD